eukprot:m.908197 g.908197  ORF g.908197 m.908197 type:complete len:378 (-) comp60099_c0_seq2:1773-2906(-)
MRDNHYFKLVDELDKQQELRTFLEEMLTGFCLLVNSEAEVFPSDWFTMYLMQLLQRGFEFMTLALFNYFDEKEYQPDLWQLSFLFSVDFACQKHLQVETMSAARKQKVITKRDKRVIMVEHVSGMWCHLSRAAKAAFIPKLLGPFIKFSLLPSVDIRKALMEIFLDMMVCDLEKFGNISAIETAFIEHLDHFVAEGWGDLEYKDTFYSYLKGKIGTHSSAFIRQHAPSFIENVTRLVGLLIGLRSVPAGDDHRDSRAAALYDLLVYYQQINCEAFYLKYLYKLFDLHVAAESHIEAAFTLVLHASKLRWPDDLPPEYRTRTRAMWSSRSALARFSSTDRSSNCLRRATPGSMPSSLQRSWSHRWKRKRLTTESWRSF